MVALSKADKPQADAEIAEMRSRPYRAAYDKSGLVMVAIHISAPTASRYGLLRISAISASVYGSSALESGAIPGEAGMMLVLSMPKRSATVRAYRRWSNVTVRALRSRVASQVVRDLTKILDGETRPKILQR